MDVLTSVLETLRFHSTLYCRVEIGAPWGLYFAPTRVATFHVIDRGSCWLRLDGATPVLPLAGGDLVVFPHGAGHQLGDTPETLPITTIQLDKDIPSEPEVRCYPNTGGTTRFLCGLFDITQPAGHTLLALLPPLIHIKGEDGQSVPWLEAMLKFLASEVGSGRLGSDTLVRRLTDMLFVQVIRAWVETSPVQEGNWLAALRDPQIGAALALMHRYPERSWTVATLAGTVSMSRSAFAARFSYLVGDPPLQYLRRWRIQKAIEMLLHTEHRIAEIASSVGYESEVSFSQVFKRQIGHAPQEYRRRVVAAQRSLSG
ncbi:AraC family transcriptional regulator [Candidatus Gracilibacteria bacterium]|nr:AraC family transcriptional regulator [Candidatus Gracilibacteria bacterium]